LPLAQSGHLSGRVGGTAARASRSRDSPIRSLEGGGGDRSEHADSLTLDRIMEILAADLKEQRRGISGAFDGHSMDYSAQANLCQDPEADVTMSGPQTQVSESISEMKWRRG
jgi:hypothetical protein